MLHADQRFFSAIGQHVDLVDQAYELAYVYKVAPQNFLSEPISALVRLIRRTSAMLERHDKAQRKAMKEWQDR